MEHALLLANLGSTALMTGVIWTVQLVHYPSFVHVSAADWPAFHRAHVRSISWIVGPCMLVELASSIALCVARPEAVPAVAVGAGVALVVVLWLTTALVQAPLHAKLAARADADLVRSLVRGNWLRTAGWSLRLALVLWMVALVLDAA